MFVTSHSHVTDPALANRLWTLYETAYLHMADQSPSHEMLFREEFDDSLREPTNRIWVLWDDDAPVAMGLIATDIAHTRYLSRNFFDGRFPDHARRGAIHYIMLLVVHPVYAARGAIIRIAREVLQREAADGALLVFDAPEVHQAGPGGGFAEMMDRAAKAFVGEAPVHHLGTSYYFAVDLAAIGEVDASEPAGIPARQHR